MFVYSLKIKEHLPASSDPDPNLQNLTLTQLGQVGVGWNRWFVPGLWCLREGGFCWFGSISFPSRKED